MILTELPVARTIAAKPDEMGRRHAEDWQRMLNLLAERCSVHEEA